MVCQKLILWLATRDSVTVILTSYGVFLLVLINLQLLKELILLHRIDSLCHFQAIYDEDFTENVLSQRKEILANVNRNINCYG